MELLISPQDIAARVGDLAAEISRDLAGQDLVLLGILSGSFIFLSDLARAMSIPLAVDFIRLASYGQGSQSSGRVRMTKAPELDLTGRQVLVVEDIVDTGLTLHWLLDHLQEQGVGGVKTCVLIDKAERRRIQVQLDYVGFEVPGGFLVGYGLDFNEQYRNLPGIYELRM